MDIKEMKNDPRRYHKIKVNGDKCMGCMKCMKTCCYDVYKWDKVNKQPIPAYTEECVSCMQCVHFCPARAIELEKATVAFFDPFFDPFDLNN